MLAVFAPLLMSRLVDSDKDAAKAATECWGAVKGSDALIAHASEILGMLYAEKQPPAKVIDAQLALVSGWSTEVHQAHIDLIIPALRHPLQTVRTAAVGWLARLSVAMLTLHAAAIVACLSSADAAVRAVAVGKLVAFEPMELEKHVLALEAHLSSPGQEVREAAMEVVQRLEPRVAAPLAELLMKLHIKDSSSKVRALAMPLLAALEPQATAALAVKVLADSKWNFRKLALEFLVTLPREALAPHSPELLQRLVDSDKDVKKCAEATWAAVGSEALVPHAVMLVGQLDIQQKVIATAVVEIINAWAVSVLDLHGPLLVEKLKHADAQVRVAAVSWVGKLAAASMVAPHVPALVEHLAHTDPNVRNAAVKWLLDIGGEGEIVSSQASALCALFAHLTHDIRQAALTVAAVLPPSLLGGSASQLVNIHICDSNEQEVLVERWPQRTSAQGHLQRISGGVGYWRSSSGSVQTPLPSDGEEGPTHSSPSCAQRQSSLPLFSALMHPGSTCLRQAVLKTATCCGGTPRCGIH